MERYIAEWDPRIDTAARRLGQAMARSGQEVAGHIAEDIVIDSMIALESMFTVNQEIGFRLGASVAHLLGANAKERHEIYSEVKALYALRSKIVHGSAVPDLLDDQEDRAIRLVIQVMETLLFDRRDLLNVREWDIPAILGLQNLTSRDPSVTSRRFEPDDQPVAEGRARRGRPVASRPVNDQIIERVLLWVLAQPPATAYRLGADRDADLDLSDAEIDDAMCEAVSRTLLRGERTDYGQTVTWFRVEVTALGLRFCGQWPTPGANTTQARGTKATGATTPGQSSNASATGNTATTSCPGSTAEPRTTSSATSKPRTN